MNLKDLFKNKKSPELKQGPVTWDDGSSIDTTGSTTDPLTEYEPLPKSKRESVIVLNPDQFKEKFWNSRAK